MDPRLSLTRDELDALVRTHAADAAAWRPHVTHDPAERSYALLHRDARCEVYVIGWMDGHDTGWHDHDDAAAAIAVVEGLVVEERFALGGPVIRRYGRGDAVSVPRTAIHRVRHGGGGPATTIHAYSPPLARVGSYEVGEEGTLLRHSRDAEAPLEPVGLAAAA
ncbi:hypothetical protein [Conexibacter sp. SYSU D00693]|uniref:hypothetical protein n=1 Tax=Conexibacter sp. SYSU D00693 TaxID=2812560 RepID=UPI00196B1E59|nr:hypothetical protein [Conexibacter sp. SYSU D00693]